MIYGSSDEMLAITKPFPLARRNPVRAERVTRFIFIGRKSPDGTAETHARPGYKKI